MSSLFAEHVFGTITLYINRLLEHSQGWCNPVLHVSSERHSDRTGLDGVVDSPVIHLLVD